MTESRVYFDFLDSSQFLAFSVNLESDHAISATTQDLVPVPHVLALLSPYVPFVVRKEASFLDYVAAVVHRCIDFPIISKCFKAHGGEKDGFL